MTKMPKKTSLTLAALTVTMVLTHRSAAAQEPKPSDSFQTRVMPLLTQYCGTTAT